MTHPNHGRLDVKVQQSVSKLRDFACSRNKAFLFVFTLCK